VSFSVLLSVYVKEVSGQFNEALLSIWDQQILKPGQIVVVKDGPLTSELDAQIRHWQDKLGSILTVVPLPENLGLGAALKAGLSACKYEIVARMDGDDLASPDRFKKQYQFLTEHSDIDILGTWVREMSYKGVLLGVRKNPEFHDQIISCLWSCPLIHPSVMLRRSRIMDVGSYSPAYRRRQDYELWFRCAKAGLRFHNLPEPLLFYRFGKHTHKKQTLGAAWQQGVVGYRGSADLKLPRHKRLACFVPFFRTLLPGPVQHIVYRALRPLDPRSKD
jgi:glycosyltransferase involved in cell wall biosynthesis